MGCKGSKLGKQSKEDEAVEFYDRDGEAATSWEEQADRGEQRTDVGERQSTQKRGILMDSSVISTILSMMGATTEQAAFFEVWAKHVHDPAIAMEAGPSSIFLSVDLRYLEARVTGPSDAMERLLRTFVAKVRDLPDKSIKELGMLLSALQANMESTPLLTVWCKIKHCRSDMPPPSVDCGYLLNQDLQWAVIDVMMPSHEDQDALRDYCLGEKHVPVLYGSSILPVAPERQLGFELVETAALNSRQILLTAFFFFKALGLMKPEDRIVRIMNSCQSSQLVVVVGIGPGGLVRMCLSMVQPKDKKIAKELAEELSFQYREKDIDEIVKMLGGDPDIIDYVGETKGYGIRLGFTST